jgi:fibronectin-binding autotransporter adhesin
MVRLSKSRLLVGSAAIGLTAFTGSSPVLAQAFGIHNDEPVLLEIVVEDGEVVEGEVIGVYADNGAIDLTVEEGGTVRGNGTDPGDTDRRADGGVVIAQPDSVVVNSGLISGAAHGVTTSAFYGEDANDQPLPPEARATSTTVVNTAMGAIIGEGGHGVALVGGGSVTNSGYIRGEGLDVSGTILDNSTGVVIAAFPDQEPVDGGIGSITNLAGGLIEGGVYGALLSGGGTIDNAGTIRSLNQQAAPGTAPFGVIVSATNEQAGRAATVNNSGTITGSIGMLATGNLEAAVFNNDGLIGGQSAGVFNGLTAGGTLAINNLAGGTIQGAAYGVRSASGGLVLNNEEGATISSPRNAVEIASADAVVNNAGVINGGNYGINTQLTLNPQTQEFEALAAGAQISNSGLVVGRNNDAIRLEGGGSVDNSGTIRGEVGFQTDGISMFPGPVQSNEEFFASVTNQDGGTIYGDRFGVILSGGGTVDNAGDISGNAGAVFVQGIALNSEEEEDRAGLVATVINSGTIRDLGPAENEGQGVGFGSDLGEATLINSGVISSANSVGVSQGSTADLLIQNLEDGAIEGATSGIYGGSSGSMTIENAGTIRGNGTYDGLDFPPDAGITIATAGSSVANTGTISGAGAGITTAYVYDAEADVLVGLATGTIIANSGVISGEANDGVRLIGGGLVANSGSISGAGSFLADGISMYRFDDQGSDDYIAVVANEAEGTIVGERFGIILSGGADVENAGVIMGGLGGAQLQSQGPDAGQIATLVNDGTIVGLADSGLTFAGDLDAALLDNAGTIAGAGEGVIMAIRGDSTVVNSGAIDGETLAGVWYGSDGDLLIQNLADGSITGATSGIYGGSIGTMTIENAGTIRGEGTYDAFDFPPDAGVTIATASSSVTNSGTISGAGAGITTAYLFDEATGVLVGLATGTTVVNSGTISGEANDGVRLIGGGAVTNSGTISGSGAIGADGVSMFRFEDQTGEDYDANVANDVGGIIAGERFGVILSGGGAIANAGTLVGGLGGAQIQSQGEEPGQSAELLNSGTILGEGDYGIAFAGSLDEAILANAGTIAGATGGIVLDIRGASLLENAGTIDGGSGLAIAATEFTGSIALVNSGSLLGGALLSTFDDTVVLRTGSDIVGGLDADLGNDSLTLEGSVLELTDAQVLGAAANFESLAVAAGYWNTAGFVGAFDAVSIAQGATLRVNETIIADEITSPILTGLVALDGALILDFSEDDIVSGLDDLSITGAGSLQLVGEAVFTVDTDTLAYTGGTTIANGGLVLTGTLAGDVTTSGDGFFKLGNGGTEGNFAGDIVNDGRFVFDRSDDYDFLGSFSGSGALDKYGAGVLTFMGDYSFEGITNIFAGAVRIGGVIDPQTEFDLGNGATLDITGNDQTIAGLEGEGDATVQLGPQTLTVDQEGDTDFAGTISGTGAIVKSGSGVLNLTGNSTYTGPTEINGGTLAVNGSIVSNVTINSGGKLGGNGTVGSTGVGSGGQLAPGNSIGRLTVAGNLSFAPGSIYEVEVNATGAADRVDATGQVVIANTARVAVLAEAGAYAPRTDYTILTGAGGITGTFGSVTTDLAFLDPLLRYGANTVTLSLYRNDIDFTDVAVNANQFGVAGAVQALGFDNPLFETVLVQNAATAQTTFGELSGEIFSSTITGLTDDSRHLRNAILAMPAPQGPGPFVWGSAFGGWGEFDATSGAAGMDADHRGVIAGLGFGGAGFGVAVSAGLGGSEFELSSYDATSEVESKYLAAHASIGSSAGFRGTAGVTYAWHEVDTARSISGAALGQSLASARDADTLQVFGEIGYGLVAGNVLIAPFARLAHVRTESESFSEAGGSAALALDRAQQETTFLGLGAEARFNTGSAGFQPYVSAAWSHAFGDREAVQVSRFTAGGPSFAVAGLAIPEDSAEIEAGFDYTSGTFSIGGAYSGTLASDRTSHGARITARLEF